MRKPLLIVVSGAPGSGKSTLARALGEHLRLPHIPRDEILRGIEMTEGHPIDRGGHGIEVYYSVVCRMLDSGISLVTDGTMYKNLSEKDIIEHFVSRSTTINVHVYAKNEQERFVRREQERFGWSNDWVVQHKKRLTEIYHKTVEPLELDIPVIRVDATSGYDPPIKEIVSRVRELYSDTRPGIL